ncbi:MAG: hypothetical protein FJY37_04450 [Betaproteobacteria bacterium]|nr:hypothetical protein [Betaproteobacteria bacterium]
MLSWIKLKRSDHPLEDPEEAKRVVDEMLAAEPFYALGQISAYLDNVKTAEHLTPMRAMEIVDSLDRAARKAQRRLNYEYVSQGRPLTRFQRNRIWSTAYDYWMQLAEGYRHRLTSFEVGALGSLALKPHLPKLIARTARARAQQIKWALLCYDAIDVRIWEDLARLYTLAEAGGFHTNQVQLYRAGNQDSSVQREVLRALMLSVSAPDGLLPLQIEVTDRLVALCTGEFQLLSKNSKELLFCSDLGTGQPPTRMSTSTRITPGTRFFGASRACQDILMPLITTLSQGRPVPKEVNLGIHPGAALVMQTAQHLARHWSLEPPRRGAVREKRLEKVSVVHGFDEVVANAGGLFLDYPFVSNDESWTVENEGGGLGMFVTRPHGSWLRAGTLVAVRRDERVTWSVGIVRRVTSDADGNHLAGVEIISESGTAVTILPVAPNQSTEATPQGEICALLSRSEGGSTTEAVLLLRPSVRRSGVELEMRAFDRSYRLKPAKVLMHGEDYEVVRCKLAK